MNPYMLMLLMMQQQQRQQQQQGNPGGQFLNQAVQAYAMKNMMGATTLGGANTIGSLPGISGASVTGGAQGAGLGGAGTSSLAAMWPAAAVMSIPMIGAALDSKNAPTFNQAMMNIATGNANQAPMGLGITRENGATFAGGDPNALDRALEMASKRGIQASRINPSLASFQANPKNLETHLKVTQGIRDKFKGADNRAAARAASNARSKGYNVTEKSVQNNIGGVRKSMRPEMIERRLTQGGR